MATVLGTDLETRQLLAVAEAQRRQGTYVIGLQGMGKSTLLAHLILQDLDARTGLCLLDPHTDLVHDIIAKADLEPDRVLLLDPADHEHPFGLNLFGCDDPSNPAARTRSRDFVLGIFKKLWGPDGVHPSWGPRIEDLLSHLTQTFVHAQAYTLVDVPPFLEDEAFRHQVLRSVPEHLQRYWHAYGERKDQASYRDSTLVRVRTFTDHEILRPILGQPRSTVNFAEIMDEGKIVLVKLAEGELGREGVTLIGSLILSQILQVMTRRVSQDRLLRRPFSLYCDEFHLLATDEFARFYAEGRKFGIQTVVAHQARYQLDRMSREATAAVVNRVCFRVGPSDAQALAPWFDEAEVGTERIVVTDPIRFLIDHGHPDARVRQLVGTLYAVGYQQAQEYADLADRRQALSDLQRYNLQRTGRWSIMEQQEMNAGLWAGAIRSINLYLYAAMSGATTPRSPKDYRLYRKAAARLLLALAPVASLPPFPADPWTLPPELRPSRLREPPLASPTRQLVHRITTHETKALVRDHTRGWTAALVKLRASRQRLIETHGPLIDLVYARSGTDGFDPTLASVLRSLLVLRKILADSPLIEPAYRERQYKQARPEVAQTLRTLPEHRALVVLGLGTQVKQTTIETLAPRPSAPQDTIARRLAAIREHAHAVYTRPRAQVEQDIRQRQRSDGERPRPRITRTV